MLGSSDKPQTKVFSVGISFSSNEMTIADWMQANQVWIVFGVTILVLVYYIVKTIETFKKRRRIISALTLILTAWGLLFFIYVVFMGSEIEPTSWGEISGVIVGADRIVANGDTANKIGTYTLAVLAKEHGIPFYVAAPTTTLDTTLDRGIDIPIEQRSPEEVTHVQGVAIAPEGTEALNPAFDVTPHRLITAIITERGIIREPYEEGLKYIFRG